MVAQQIDTVDQQLHFFSCGNIWQRSRFGWLDDLHPIHRLAQHMPIEEGQSPQIHLDGAPGIVLHHPGKVGLELSGAQIVRTAVKASCNAAHCSGIAIDCFTPLALQLEGLQVLCIELVERSCSCCSMVDFPQEIKDMTHRCGRASFTVELGDQPAMQATPAAQSACNQFINITASCRSLAIMAFNVPRSGLVQPL